MVLERIKEMLAERFDTSADSITETSRFTDLGLDSLDLMEMVTDLEDEFNITIDTEDLTADTVGAFVELIETLRNS